MKKIALCSLLACLGVVDASFAGNCTMTNRSLSTADSDFVFFGGAGTTQGLACGQIGGRTCNYSEFAIINGTHRIGSKQYTKTGVYKCVDATGNLGVDPWTKGYESELQVCSPKNHKGWKEVGRDDNNVYLANALSTSGSLVFAAGNKTGMCRIAISKYDPDDFCNNCVKPDPTPDPTPSKKKSCKEKFAGYPERIKCCEAGSATVWQPKDDLANGQCICVNARKEWKNGKCVDRNISCEQLYPDNPAGVACCKIGKVYFLPGHTCLCGEGLKWVYDEKTKTGQCVADNGGGNDVVPTPVVPGGDCVYYFNGSVKCANGNTYSETTSYPIDANGDCEAAKRLFAQDEANLMKIKEKICQGHGSYIVIVNESEVKAAESTLLSFFGTAKSGANVWKDTEGNFNTARLASDLTAGVVLGTVGGVVSGVVIKKKQVEKGFDALHCTVGGQTIADWGDLFNVGLRR